MQYLNPYIEICLEGPSSFFKGLNQKDKDAIANNHSYSVIKKGNLLFSEGEKIRGLICLVSGKVKVFKQGVAGREQILKMAKQNTLIGYRSLFSENTWSFSAGAVEDSAVCILDKGTVIKILRKNADLSFRLARMVSDDLGFSINRTVSLTQKHIRGRIAESLLVLRDVYGFEADGKTLHILLSREDMASLSNMTTSNAIRTLSSLGQEGIIKIAGRKISILDGPQLEYICEMG